MFYGINLFSPGYSWWEGGSDVPLVNADMIGSIIAFDGDIEVRDANGRKIVDEMLKNGDTVVLDAWSSMLLGITDSFTTKIVWPAKFQIIQQWFGDDQTYRIKLIEWDFVAVQKNENTNDTKRLSVETNDGLVAETNATLESDFVVAKDKNDSSVIYNNSSDANSTVKVTKTDPVTQQMTTQNVQHRQKAVIQEDKIVMTNVDDAETKTISDKAEENVAASISVDSTTPLSDLLDVWWDVDVWSWWQEEIIENIQPLVVDGKKILTDEEMYLLEQYLLGVFLKKDTQDLTLSYGRGYQRGVDISLVNLGSKIKKAYETIWIKVSVDTKNFATFVPSLTNLISVLENEYHAPLTVLQNLRTLKSRVDILERTIEFGVAPDAQNMTEILEKYELDNPRYAG